MEVHVFCLEANFEQLKKDNELIRFATKVMVITLHYITKDWIRIVEAEDLYNYFLLKRQ